MRRSRPLARVLRIAALGLALVAVRPVPANAQAQLDPKFWISNWTINDVARYGDRLYLAGGFWVLGPHTGAAVPMDPVTAQRLPQFPKFLGTDHSTVSIRRILPDGAGGWYVGGQFATADGLPRANLAHVAADYTVSAWNPGANGIVEDLILDGTTLYVGGWFTQLAGQTRNRLGAVSTVTGAATAFHPNIAGGAVLELEKAGGTMHVGGAFTVVGGQLRTALAAVDVATGTPLAWDANLVGGSQVSAMVLDGTTLYIGGGVSSVNGTARSGFAALDAATAALLPYNPGSAGGLNDMLIHGGKLYLGGFGFTLDGQGRQGLAALDLSTGSLTPWTPWVGGNVYAITILANTIYVAGDFDYVKDSATDPDITDRNNLAAFDLTTGLPTSWDPIGEVNPSRALATDGAAIYAGGSFATVNGIRRLGFGALDWNTGEALSWTPPPHMESVTALCLDGSTLFVAGSFDTTLTGRSRLAAFDAATGTLLPWAPLGNVLTFGSIDVMVCDATTVYVGGSFSGARQGLAAFDKTTGALLAWNANTNGTVYSIALNGNDLLVGGAFSTIGGQPRQRLAAVDKSSGAVGSWNPAPSNSVRDLDVAGGTIFVGGEFTAVAGQARSRLASFDAGTYALTAWNPGANSRVEHVETDGGAVYIAGAFSTCGNPVVARNLLAALDPVTGASTGFVPGLDPSNGAIHCLVLDGPRVITSGSYVSIAGQPRTGLAVLTDLEVAPVGVAEIAGRAGAAVRAFPNPMRAGGAVEFDAPHAASRVRLSLVDVAGRRVRTVFDGAVGAGRQRVALDTDGLAAGVYFVRMQGAGDDGTAKVVVTR